MITIPGRLPTLNEYINAERGNKYHAAKIKKHTTEVCSWYFSHMEPLEHRVHITFKWYRKDKRTDPDNIAFAKKFILDSMVQADVIKNDGWNEISGFEDIFIINPDERVEIIFKGTFGFDCPTTG